MQLIRIRIRFIYNKKVRGGLKLKKQSDLKRIIANLSKLGVSATVTKSRVELLKVLTPPVSTPHTHN